MRTFSLILVPSCFHPILLHWRIGNPMVIWNIFNTRGAWKQTGCWKLSRGQVSAKCYHQSCSCCSFGKRGQDHWVGFDGGVWTSQWAYRRLHVRGFNLARRLLSTLYYRNTCSEELATLFCQVQGDIPKQEVFLSPALSQIKCAKSVNIKNPEGIFLRNKQYDWFRRLLCANRTDPDKKKTHIFPG